jgi:hypothetical protein
MTAPLSLSECARAASASESRYRITRPIVPARNARVVALDERAAAVAGRLASGPWAVARFYTCAPGGRLRGLDGTPATPADLAIGTDVVVVIATDDSGRDHAAAIGEACRARSVMMAGVVLGDAVDATDAVAALRPYARVLLLSADESDVFDLLTALRV